MKKPKGKVNRGRDAKALQRRIDRALTLIVAYGGIDGDHHKAWVLDQVARTLAAGRYKTLVKEAKAGEDGPETYSWDVGIAP